MRRERLPPCAARDREESPMSRSGCRRIRCTGWFLSWLLPALALCLPGGAARAESAAITCPTVTTGEELREPPVIAARGGKIDTTFRVEERELCVPVTGSGGTITNTPTLLRTYVYPDPSNPQKWIYGFPGPTLRLRKPSAPGGRGDSLAILLVNNLPSDGGMGCDSACPAGSTCPKGTSQLPDPALCFQSQTAFPCCCWIDVNQHHPDCYHGDNTTNLHFHGTHVSPQSPQDYVLLELHPKADAAKNLAPMNPRGTSAFGEFHYKVDPLPYTQADGTHWYHPHKHGSVSLQVGNGMPGAIEIEGPFDDWLRQYYGGRLVEKLLVMQQVQQTTNLYNPTAAPPPMLVNGQVSPKVTMRPGEVQRWRFVNATMQVASQVSLQFPAGVTVRQIAMDGVQFAPETYAKQPLFIPTYPNQFNISPGNRADFLVQAPAQAGSFVVRQKVFGNRSQRTDEKLRLRERAVKALVAPAEAANAAVEAPLFTLAVEEAKAPAGAKLKAVAQGFPTPAQWPPMPPYLRKIPDGDVRARVNPLFAMPPGTGATSSGPGNPATIFTIDGTQYDDKCVNVTTRLGTADEWTIQNSSALLHPFHIHTNPFELSEEGTVIGSTPVAFRKYDPPIWQDTIALPAVDSSWDVNAGPIANNDAAQKICPGVCQAAHQGTWKGQWATTVPGRQSVCGCNYTGNGYVKLRHRYLEFTGEYVLHCHFLGHEDRGMMFGVQTVCRDDPKSFGKARLGGQPECVPGNLIPAAPQCPPTSTAAAKPAE
jgi:FtsP/CotA-like multicopper oxidase with cupredoxin domain